MYVDVVKTTVYTNDETNIPYSLVVNRKIKIIPQGGEGCNSRN